MNDEDDETKRALDAFRAMREGGRKGGSATGDAKRRSPEHYAAAATKAAIGRARSKGLKLFECRLVETLATIGRVEAANKTDARAKIKLRLKKGYKAERITIEEVTT